MRFRIKKREAPAAGFQRVCLEELDGTRELLGTAREAMAALHEARKQLKKLRALLRLARPAFGPAAVAAAGSLRDAAALLARHRESDALRVLLEREARIAGSADFDILETSLRLHQIAHAPVGNRSRDLEAARRVVGGVQRRLGAVPVAEMTPALCRRRLRKTYRKARLAFGAARRRASAEAVHDLRKASKRLLNQARLLRAWGGKPFTAFRRELVRVDDLLGRARDCGALAAILRGVPAAEAPLRHGYGLRARLEQAAREALDEALRRGGRAYRLKPRAFAERMLL